MQTVAFINHSQIGYVEAGLVGEDCHSWAWPHACLFEQHTHLSVLIRRAAPTNISCHNFE